MAVEKTATTPPALEKLELLRCTLDGAILRLEFNNPPYNMLTAKCMSGSLRKTTLSSGLNICDR